jgi:hypothetical protein
MRFPEVVRMADDSGPVWARSKRGGGGGGFFGLLMALLSLFAILVIVLAVMDKGFAKGGAQMDGWIHSVVSMVHKDAKKADDKAGQAATATADATQAAGAAAAADATKAADAMKSAAPAKK